MASLSPLPLRFSTYLRWSTRAMVTYQSAAPAPQKLQHPNSKPSCIHRAAKTEGFRRSTSLCNVILVPSRLFSFLFSVLFILNFSRRKVEFSAALVVREPVSRFLSAPLSSETFARSFAVLCPEQFLSNARKSRKYWSVKLIGFLHLCQSCLCAVQSSVEARELCPCFQ